MSAGACTLFALVASVAAPAADHGPYAEQPGTREFSGQMLARPVQSHVWARTLSASEVAARRGAAEAEVGAYPLVEYVPQTDEFIILVPLGSSENAVAEQLLATGLFEYVEPDWIVYPLGCPNDASFASQWHHQASRMQSCDGWALHTGRPTIGVGICDTGVLTTHVDLQLHRLQGYNAVSRLWESQGGDISPVNPHGTQTTGCAAANGNNQVGVAGVGWNLSHRMLRVSNLAGGGANLSVLQHAARTSIEAGDRVASVSYTGVDSSSNLTTATYIKSIGGLLFWAAGNDNHDLTLNDRDADDLIVVSATDQNDQRAGFSNYGVFVDVAAPGVSVYTTSSTSDTSYTSVNGTSFACPLAAGLAALLFSADPTLSPDDVEQLLKQSCEDLGGAGADIVYGYGRINVYAALLASGVAFADCNANGVNDGEDIALGSSRDCNGNGIPDECELTDDRGLDCGDDPAFDHSDGTSPSEDCNDNGIPDGRDLSSGASQDCNGNEVPDECDIAAGTSSDANGNGVPDECDPPVTPKIWLTLATTTTIPGVGSVASQDIVAYDEAAASWSLIFDGSDVGLDAYTIDGLAVLGDGSMLLSLTGPATLAGVGSVDDSDIVRFIPTSLGADTAGSFEMYFQGADVGLDTSGEDVDAIEIAPDGRLVISMVDTFNITGATGADEDLVIFNATSLGWNTAGSFQLYFDGSDVGLDTTTENVDALAILTDGGLLLSTTGSFSVPGLAGGGDDVFSFTPTSLGSTTAGTYAARLNPSALGINANVMAVALVTK